MSALKQQLAAGSVCMRVADLTVVLADSGEAIVKGISGVLHGTIHASIHTWRHVGLCMAFTATIVHVMHVHGVHH